MKRPGQGGFHKHGGKPSHHAKGGNHGHAAGGHGGQKWQGKPWAKGGKRPQGEHKGGHPKEQAQANANGAMATSAPAPTSAELNAATHLLLGVDHKQVRWWDVEATLEGARPAKGEGKGAAAAAARTGRTQKKEGANASAEKQPAGLLPRPSVKRGEAALEAAVQAFEAKRAKGMTQQMRWTEKVSRQGAWAVFAKVWRHLDCWYECTVYDLVEGLKWCCAVPCVTCAQARCPTRSRRWRSWCRRRP
jgi:hypothetical protein